MHLCFILQLLHVILTKGTAHIWLILIQAKVMVNTLGVGNPAPHQHLVPAQMMTKQEVVN